METCTAMTIMGSLAAVFLGLLLGTYIPRPRDKSERRR